MIQTSSKNVGTTTVQSNAIQASDGGNLVSQSGSALH